MVVNAPGLALETSGVIRAMLPPPVDVGAGEGQPQLVVRIGEAAARVSEDKVRKLRSLGQRKDDIVSLEVTVGHPLRGQVGHSLHILGQ